MLSCFGNWRIFPLRSRLLFQSSTTRERKERSRRRKGRTLPQPGLSSPAVRVHIAIQQGNYFAGCAAAGCQSRQRHSYRKSRKPCRLSEQVGENPNLLSVVTRLNTRLSPLLAPLPPADVTMPRNQLGRCRRRIPRISAWNPSLFPVVTDSISVWCWPSFSQCWFTWRGVERKLFRAQRLRSPHLRGPSPLRQRRPRNSRARQGLPCR